MRCDQPWIHQLLVVCQELPVELEAFRSGGHAGAAVAATGPPPPAAPLEAPAPAIPVEGPPGVQPAKAGGDEGPAAKASEEAWEALSWACKVKDKATVLGLMATLPEWTVLEQILAYTARDAMAVAAVGSDISRIRVDPNLWKSRVAVCAALHACLRSGGWAEGERIPYGSALAFSTQRLVWPKSIERRARRKRRLSVQWFARWQEEGKPGQEDEVNQMRSEQGKVTWFSAWKKKGAAAGRVDNGRRQRRSGAGACVRAKWVRESLFEWFVQMRSSIDWKGYNDALRRAGWHEAMGRFPHSLLYMKARTFMQEYYAACLRAGEVPRAMQLRARQLHSWACARGCPTDDIR